jgi:hypothetical protein
MDDHFQSSLEIAARQQDAMTACVAFQTNVRAKPNDRPFISTARVRFAQTNDIVE